MVQSIGAAEVLNARLCGHAGSAKKHDIVRSLHHFFQSGDIVLHHDPSPFGSDYILICGKERRIKYQYIDLKSKGLSPREYQAVRRCVAFEDLVDTKCRAYEELYMAYITPAAQEEKLLEYPELFKAPIVRNGKQATVGYHPEIWETWE